MPLSDPGRCVFLASGYRLPAFQLKDLFGERFHKLSDRTSFSFAFLQKLTELVARKIIEVAGTGERNPARISEQALAELRITRVAEI